MVAPGELDGLDPAARLQDFTAARFQEVVEELHVQLVVLDDEHGFRHRGAHPKRRRRSNSAGERGAL
jgi:hypothetical protein